MTPAETHITQPFSAPQRVLIADDHAMFREGLSYILREKVPQVEIDTAASFGAARSKLAGGLRYDLVMLDLMMPDMGWNEGLHLISPLCTTLGTPIVVVSARDTDEFIDECLRVGVRGYIPKSMSGERLVNALDCVLGGETSVPEGFTPPDRNAASAPLRRKRNTGTKPQLTARQREVLSLLGQGKSNQDIAETLGLSVGTVKVHVSRILKFLGVRSRTAAALTAAELDMRE